VARRLVSYVNPIWSKTKKGQENAAARRIPMVGRLSRLVTAGLDR